MKWPRPLLSSSTLSDRRGPWAFAFGVLLVTLGVLLHLPMFLMGRTTHYHLYGMPMGAGMYAGMAAIILGVGIAAFGLLPLTAFLTAATRLAAAFFTAVALLTTASLTSVAFFTAASLMLPATVAACCAAA